MSVPAGGQGGSRSLWDMLGVSEAIASATDAARGLGTGRFEMSPDELRSVRADWQAVAEDLDVMKRDAEPLSQVQGPGAEAASEGQAAAANQSGLRYQADLEAMQNYVGSYVAGLDRVIAEYERTDAGRAEVFGRRHGELG
ncbi:PE domain-containing protein [Actinokineospora sp.]|uniref:PE domain-containing protein n=1 Tax=Actinokineospora sp. TaxID=1872133 RepID=UPI0040378157